jgi:hypothetical protein
MGIRKFNLRMSQVRKRGKIRLNADFLFFLSKDHPNTLLENISTFLFALLQISSKKFILDTNILEGHLPSPQVMSIIIIIIVGKIISSSNRSTLYSRIVSITVLVAIEILLFAVLVVVVVVVACRLR